jgi:hypothetical protein
MLDSFRLKLETAASSDVPFLQGQIACLRACMTLPQILHEEIRSKQRRKDIARISPLAIRQCASQHAACSLPLLLEVPTPA